MNRHDPVNHGDSTSLYARIKASAAPAATPRCTGSTLQEGVEFTLETGVRCIEKFAARDNNDIYGSRRLVVAKQLAGSPLGAIADDGSANLASCRNAQPRVFAGRRTDKQRHEPPAHFGASRVDGFELSPAPNVLVRAKAHRSSDTVNRFRPLARRRFSTCWPSLVSIRTRNPCVFFRRRLFG